MIDKDTFMVVHAKINNLKLEGDDVEIQIKKLNQFIRDSICSYYKKIVHYEISNKTNIEFTKNSFKKPVKHFISILIDLYYEYDNPDKCKRLMIKEFDKFIKGIYDSRDIPFLLVDSLTEAFENINLIEKGIDKKHQKQLTYIVEYKESIYLEKYKSISAEEFITEIIEDLNEELSDNIDVKNHLPIRKIFKNK